MPTLPSALICPIAQPDSTQEETLESESAEAIEGQGRGAAESRPLAKVRRRRVVASADKTSKRGLYLTDSVWERLQLEAIRKRTNVSAIAGEFLERNLPRLRIERDV
jgi:precorrin isomerase